MCSRLWRLRVMRCLVAARSRHAASPVQLHGKSMHEVLPLLCLTGRGAHDGRAEPDGAAPEAATVQLHGRCMHEGGGLSDPVALQGAARTTDALNLTALPRRVSAAEIDDFRVAPAHVPGGRRGWEVSGEALQRFAAMTNWDYYEATLRFQQVLEVSGARALPALLPVVHAACSACTMASAGGSGGIHACMHTHALCTLVHECCGSHASALSSGGVTGLSIN